MNHDLHGRTAIVTGATGGIGKETARHLARMGARVVLASRTGERGAATYDELVQETGSREIELIPVDLSSRQSIRAFVEQVLSRHAAIHVLVNSAAVWVPRRQLSEDGVELTWATNVLGGFYLTRLLLDRLRAGAPSRVVNVASEFAFGLDLGDVQFERRAFNGMTAYAQSKQAHRMLTWALARRLAGSGVVAHAVHPGTVNSGLYRNLRGLAGGMVAGAARRFGRSPATAADTPAWLAADPAIANVNGRYWHDRRERRCPFRDQRQLETLWTLCERMTAKSPALEIAAG